MRPWRDVSGRLGPDPPGRSSAPGLCVHGGWWSWFIIATGNSDAGKTHMALGLGLAACQRGMPVGFTAAALVHELMEARDERRLLNLQRQLSRLSLLIIDELGFVPLSPHRGGVALRGLQPALRAGLQSW